MRSTARIVGCLLIGAVSCRVDVPGASAVGVDQPADLPVPHEMRLLSGVNQSRAYQVGSFRSASLHYRGPLRIAELRSFLRARLPEHGWELVEEERPVRERLLQRWRKVDPSGAVYRLSVELSDDGARRHLIYELRTKRRGAAADASADRRD